MGAEGIWRRLRPPRRFFLLRRLRKFLRWSAGRPPVDGFEIGLGSDRHIAGCGGGWPRVAARAAARIGRAKRPADILAAMVMVAEAVYTARSVPERAVRMEVDMPITAEVY